MIHINLVTEKYPLHGSGNNLSQVSQCHRKVVSLRTLLLPLQHPCSRFYADVKFDIRFDNRFDIKLWNSFHVNHNINFVTKIKIYGMV